MCLAMLACYVFVANVVPLFVAWLQNYIAYCLCFRGPLVFEGVCVCV